MSGLHIGLSHADTTVCTTTWYKLMQYMLQLMNPTLILSPHTELDPQFRDRTLTPVMSGQVRELTAKMLIPSSRIRLMDTLGHGKIA